MNPNWGKCAQSAHAGVVDPRHTWKNQWRWWVTKLSNNTWRIPCGCHPAGQNPAVLAVLLLSTEPPFSSSLCRSGNFVPHFAPSLALNCSISCSWLCPSHPSTFPCDQSHVLSLFWLTFPFSWFTKHSAEFNINLPSVPAPERCSGSCLANKASMTRRIAILKSFSPNISFCALCVRSKKEYLHFLPE